MLKLKNLTDKELVTYYPIRDIKLVLKPNEIKRFDDDFASHFLMVYGEDIENLTLKESSPDYRKETEKDIPLSLMDINESFKQLSAKMDVFLQKLELMTAKKPNWFKRICLLIRH